jgi:pyridoxine/pyridoxamine 5'-phosphate oxidase
MPPSRSEPRGVPVEAPAVYPFPREAEGLLPWAHAAERLERARTYWLATVRPDGRPHVAPLWGVWIDDALYFDGLPTTRWARNLAANPAATAHLERGDDVVIVEGIAEDVTTTAELGARIVAAWDAKYGRLAPDPAGSGLFRLRPVTVRAWSSESLRDGTRWHFPPG